MPYSLVRTAMYTGCMNSLPLECCTQLVWRRYMPTRPSLEVVITRHIPQILPFHLPLNLAETLAWIWASERHWSCAMTMLFMARYCGRVTDPAGRRAYVQRGRVIHIAKWRTCRKSAWLRLHERRDLTRVSVLT